MSGPAIPPRLWDHYPAPFRPGRPPAWRGGAGGLSGSDLWRVDAAIGPLVLRRWPTDGPTPTDLDQAHAWVARARPIPYVAVPLGGAGGATWFEVAGRLWELTPLRPGVADLAIPPSPAHLAAMFATLAAFHSVLTTQIHGRSPGLIARSDELNRLLGGEFAALGSILDRTVHDDRTRDARRWLDLAGRTAPTIAGPLHSAADRIVALQPCIRDVRPDHFLFVGDELTGLVDFGAMGVDTVATDLARLLGETTGADEACRRVAIAAYEAIRPLSDADHALVAEFEAANAVLGGARWVRWHFVDGRAFRDSDAVAAGLTRACRRLEAFNSRRPAASGSLRR